MTTKAKTQYFTTDTITLAAWLHSLKFKMAGWEKFYVFNGNGMQTITQFHFELASGIEESARDFCMGCATGRINDYENSRRELMRIAKMP